MTAHRFIEPLDVLFLRGNKLFGDPGSFGESLVPPWPSVAAGAIRSQMLANEGIDLAAFAAGRIDHPQLGTPEHPGRFAIVAFLLARRTRDSIETLHPLPADLIATRDGAILRLHQLQPTALSAGIESSAPLPRVPVLAADSRTKPESGIWLTQRGWQQYLDGELPAAEALAESKTLWKLDPRVGVGLDAEKCRADDGKLFTVQAVAMVKRGHPIGYGKGAGDEPIRADYDVGFLAAIDGAEPPASGTLRLGGDGRAAAFHAVEHRAPEPDYQAIAQAGRCRVVLTSPGIFPGGWRFPGLDAENRFAIAGVTGRLICAAVPRAEVVSGWDLAKWRPKPAQRVAPAGSVYWLDGLQATPDQLRKLVEGGLWPEEHFDAQRRLDVAERLSEDDLAPEDVYDAQRRAEGFNRCVLGVWS